MRIFKYPLTGPQTTLELPKGAQVLKVDEQGSIQAACLWALVDPEAPTEKRSFHVYGTGHEVPVGGIYIGTWFSLGGALVWHLFERSVLQASQEGDK